MRSVSIPFFLLAIAVTIAAFSAVAAAQEYGWEPNPGRTWAHEFAQGVETVTFRAASYSDLVETSSSISFKIKGLKVASPSIEKIGGAVVSEMMLKPVADGAEVVIKLRGIADGFSINSAPRSRAFPNSASVVVGFTGLRLPPKGAAAANASDDYPMIESVAATRGEYELPEFERKYRYSDALITLKTSGASVTGVIEFLSFVSGVSIILDPYWDQEPTGTVRPPLSGGGPGQGPGTGGGPGIGYRGLGTGAITVNLEDVPFDLALDLILTSAGLVYFEIG